MEFWRSYGVIKLWSFGGVMELWSYRVGILLCTVGVLCNAE